MAKEQPLWHKMSFDPLYVALTKIVGYVGFPVRALAEHTRTILEQHRPEHVGIVLREIMDFQGHRVLLNPRARHLAWQILGPPPEKWASFYTQPDGSPAPRPPGRDTPPDVTPPQIDPITDSLRLVTTGQMEDMLRKARSNKIGYLAELCAEQIQCVESEYVRRGLPIPAAPLEKPDPPPKKRAKKK